MYAIFYNTILTQKLSHERKGVKKIRGVSSDVIL